MNQHLTIQSLESLCIDDLYAVHQQAFKSYPVQWNKEEFIRLLHRRGFDARLSFGAFANDELVGFTLNGIGYFNGIKTAYDTSSGTVASHRGKGVASEIFEFSIPFLKNAGIQQYLLEVLENNERARSLYTKHGFSVSRTFDCFKADVEGVMSITNSNKPGGVEFRNIDFSYLADMEQMCDLHCHGKTISPL